MKQVTCTSHLNHMTGLEINAHVSHIIGYVTDHVTDHMIHPLTFDVADSLGKEVLKLVRLISLLLAVRAPGGPQQVAKIHSMDGRTGLLVKLKWEGGEERGGEGRGGRGEGGVE